MQWRNYTGSMFAAMLFMLWPWNAYAYIDPGTGSMLLQGLIAGIAAGLVVIRFWWYKIKGVCDRIMGRKPGVDVNSDEGKDGP